MNSHFTLKMRGFCVANLPNSLLLRAIRRLEPTHFKRKLFRPELIRASLNNAKIAANSKNKDPIHVPDYPYRHP